MGRKVNIRPTTGVYATYRKMDYKRETAIAEFVDNSTQSYFDNKDRLLKEKYYKLQIFIDYEHTKTGDKLTISDNAYGMGFRNFERALILDKPPAITTGRNEFGMGLKMAASWFGAKWSVESIEYGSGLKLYAEVDVDFLAKYKNEEIEVVETEVSTKEHGTTITIERLYQKLSNEKSESINKKMQDKIISNLSDIYRCDIRSGEIEIYFNDTLLEFQEPPLFIEKLPNNNTKEWKKEINFFVENDGVELEVKGFVAIRIPGSTSEAGFTLLRRKRVIVGGKDKNYRPEDIFGKSNSFPFQRIYGEIEMDNWPVTQSKDAFVWETNGLEEIFIEKLKNIICYEGDNFLTKARDYREKDKIDKAKVDKDGINLLEKAGIISNVTLTPVECNDDDIVVNGNTEISDDTTEDMCTETEIETSNHNLFEFDIDDNYRIKLEFKYGENSSDKWLRVNKISSENKYTIILNIRHPFFKKYAHKKDFIEMFSLFAKALVISEIKCEYIQDKSSDALRNKLNDILEVLSLGGDSIE